MDGQTDNGDFIGPPKGRGSNKKLKKLLRKSPNYTEPRTMNFSKVLIEITTAFDSCIEAMVLKTNTSSNFIPWKEKVIAKVKEKITELKQKMKPKQTKPVLSDPDLKKHLEVLHRKFVIVTIDKANNFASMCVKYYISKLLAEFPKKRFHRKSLFHTCLKKFWVIENSFPILLRLNKI